MAARRRCGSQVARKWQAADGIAGFELRPIKGLLPTFQPGAHIDVHMPNGEIRQYSITNGPGETDSYIIGVKLEPDSKGGSKCMHETVREGDVLAISEPRNNFPLRRDAIKTLFIAGGIGITPLLAMAQALHTQGLTHELHYFAQSQAQLAFPERLETLGGLADAASRPHRREQTGAKLRELLAGYRAGMHVYVCGPGPMLEAARKIAAEQGWPETAVHFEYFKNTNKIDDSSSFEIALARSCVTLQVPAGKTILRGDARDRHRHAVLLRAGRLRHLHGHGHRGRAGPSGRLSQRCREKAGDQDHDLRVARQVGAARAGHLGAADDHALRLRTVRQLLQAAAADGHARRRATRPCRSTSIPAASTSRTGS